jgi:hypothetical protein
VAGFGAPEVDAGAAGGGGELCGSAQSEPFRKQHNIHAFRKERPAPGMRTIPAKKPQNRLALNAPEGLAKDSDSMLAVKVAAASSIGPSCFQPNETRELTPRFEKEDRFASETSHAGIIRIGFEGISQPHLVEHPCFNHSD